MAICLVASIARAFAMHLLRLDFEAPYPPFQDSNTKGFLLMAVSGSPSSNYFEDPKHRAI